MLVAVANLVSALTLILNSEYLRKLCTYKIVNKFQMHLNVFMTLKDVYAYEFIKHD